MARERKQPVTPLRIACNHAMAKRVQPRPVLSTLTLVALLVAAEVASAADGTEEAASTDAVASPESGFRRDPLNGPDSVSGQLEDDREGKADLLDLNLLKQWEAWKAKISKRTGFSFGADYTSVGFAATDSLGDDTSASGIARIYGLLDVLNRGRKNTGRIDFKIEHRHRYTAVPPFAFGFEVGYAGTPEPVFNDEGFRTTVLYWKQYLLDDRAVTRVGFLDIKEYFDVYALASPWTGFGNLDFSTSANTIGAFPDGALGVMAGSYLTERIYAAAGIVDASADPGSVFQGFNTFFDDFDTFKSIEIGFTGGGDRFYLNNAHVSFWHLDDSKETGVPGGWGVIASASTVIDDKWLPFLRAAWADEGGGIYEASVSAGFGYKNKPAGSLLGVGLNWGRPNSDTFPVDLDDQFTGEVFYRIQLTENFQITPSVQLLVDPALNPDEDFIALFGLRARASF